ncbi:hypothetical protein OAE37_00180 [Pirellulaceae bacterium]|nr:hypothetical protein [Pirellulaceae bacterium]
MSGQGIESMRDATECDSIKYDAIEDAIAILGNGEVIARTFTDF